MKGLIVIDPNVCAGKPVIRGSRIMVKNIPQAISKWLKKELTDWDVHHVNELGFQGKQDDFLYLWALENKAIIVT
jgi:Protein of unknown function (DUF433)